MQALLRTVIQRQQPIDLEPADVAADANGMPTLERYSELEKFDEIQIDALYAIARLERAVRAQTGAVQLGGPPGAEKKLRDASNLIQRAQAKVQQVEEAFGLPEHVVNKQLDSKIVEELKKPFMAFEPN